MTVMQEKTAKRNLSDSDREILKATTRSESPLSDRRAIIESMPESEQLGWLLSSIRVGRLRDVKFLIEEIGLNPNSGYVGSSWTIGNGWTLLIDATFHGQKEVVDYLLEKGADPFVTRGNFKKRDITIRNHDGPAETRTVGYTVHETAYDMAISKGRTEIAESIKKTMRKIEEQSEVGILSW